MTQRTPYRIHPGEYIREEMCVRNVSREALARELDLTLGEIGGLLSAGIPVTREIADRLSRWLGTSSDIWLCLQRWYDEGTDLP